MLSGVELKQIFPVFEKILQGLDELGQLDRFRSVPDTLWVAMDSPKCFSSTQISCPQRSTHTLRSGDTQHFYRVVTPDIGNRSRQQKKS